jgi:MFS family permease
VAELATETVVAADEVEPFLAPRDDTLLERQVGEGHFELEEGPFDSYERVVSTEALADGTVRVTQQIHYRTAMPIFRGVLRRLIRKDLARLPTESEEWPWWSPPERFTARSARVLSVLCGLAVITGYGGAVTTQTMTFAAEDFGVSDAAQGNALAAIRVGVVASLVLLAIADRRGRRMILLGSVAVVGLATMSGAVAPDVFAFTGSQMITRGASSTASVLLGVVAAEEVGARSRAYAVSLLATSGGLGFMLSVVLLPLADIASWSWRLLFLAPVLFVGIFRTAMHALPESRRFEAALANRDVVAPPEPEDRQRFRRRLLLFATTGFAFSVFASPLSQLLNDFLRDERGFTGSGIALFRLATNLPGAIGIVVGGMYAETHGRRRVGAFAVLFGSLSTTGMLLSTGAPMWLLGSLGTVFIAGAVPALGVYGPEMFSTALRGRANSIITVCSVGGSIVGLVIAGQLRDELGGLGDAALYLLVAPVIVVGMILAFYPETAARELEDLNPEDAPIVEDETD